MTDLQANVTTSNNQFTAPAIGSQPLQNVSVGDDGSFVITWTSAGQDGSGTGIYFGLYDAAGNPVITELQVNAFTTGSQQNTAVAKSDVIDGVPTSGGFVITWTTPTLDGSGTGIYAQLYDQNGNIVKTEFRVNSTTLANQRISSVAMDEDGDFVITWSSGDSEYYGIYAQRYNAAGVPQGTETLINTVTTGTQENAVVAMDQDGDYVVTWVSSDGNGTGVYARRFNADGTPKDTTEFLVNTFTTDNQSEPSIAMDDAGNFIITWSSLGQDGSSNGVYGQRYSATGEKLGTEFKISTRTSGEQKNSTVSMTPDGDFIVTWSSNGQDVTGSWGVYGQRYNSDGAKQGSEFRINTTVNGDQQLSSVGMDADGGFVTAWTSPDASLTGVFYKSFDGFVNTPPTVATPIPNAPDQTEDILGGTYTFSETTFTDVDGDPLTYTATLAGGIPLPNWIIFNAATRTFTFNPTNSEGGGLYTIQVTANDGSGGSATADFTVFVNAVNDSPTLNSPLPDRTGDVDSAFEDTPFSYTFAANTFQDIDGPTLTYTAQLINGSGTAVALPAWLSFNSTTRTFSGTPDEADAGFLTIRVTASDGSLSASDDFILEVKDINDNPIADDDTATTNEETQTTITVLDGDTDPDGTLVPGSVVVVGNPTNGTAVVNANGTITYTPALDFAGIDTFTYTVQDNDGGVSNTATVTVTVNGINDAPVANDDAITMAEDGISPVIDVLANDTDVEGVGTLVPNSVVVVSGPSHGTTSVDPLTGKITYTPTANYNGTDTFTYTVQDTDGGTSNPATVTITVTSVNDAPIANNDIIGTPQETAVNINVLANDTDVEGTNTLDPASIVLGASPTKGTLVNNGDGTFTYTPNVGATGSDSFTYQVSDNEGDPSEFATVTINITARPIAGDDTATTDEDSGVTITVLTNDSDPDGSVVPGSVAIATPPAHGTAVVNPDGTITYSPTGNYFGPDSFTYTVTDNSGSVSLPATVNITVNSVNDLPVATEDSVSTQEEAPVNIVVLANDNDNIDGSIDPSSVVIASDPANGTVVVNANGTITYTPNGDFSGDDSFTYTVQDNEGGTSAPATVTITVNSVNDPPVASNDTGTTNEDTTLTLNVISNDTDVDGTVVAGTVTITSSPAHGTATANANGTVTYVPDPEYHGPDTFTYTVKDNNGAESATATVTINVVDVNDNPTAVNDVETVNEDPTTPLTIDVLANDGDIDGTLDPTTVTIVNNTQNGTVVVNADGTVTYTPNANFNGTDSFTYTVKDDDGDISNVATVNITVNAVNDAPIADDDNFTATENLPATFTILVGDQDVDGTLDPTSLAVVSAPANGVVVANPDGTFTYTPNLGFSGNDSFTYTVNDNDGATSNVATVNISVTANALPIANSDTAATIEDTASLPINVLANDSDIDGNLIPGSVAIASTPTNGSVVVNPDGTIVYTPNPDFAGTDTFTYTVTDNASGTSDPATVTVTVTGVNDLPTAGDDTASTNEDTARIINVLANDNDSKDAGGSVVPGSVAIATGPAHGTVVVNANGTITYTPTSNYFGPDSFTYTVQDNSGGTSAPATVTITVNDVNDPPVAVNDSQTLNEDTITTINVLGNDSDVDGTLDAGTVIIGTDPTNGTVTVNPDGTITYTPNENFNGTDSFTYTVQDDDGTTSNIATVNLTIDAVNDLPVAVDDTAPVTENTPTTITVLTNDSDVEGPLNAGTVVIGTLPAHGTVVVNANGTITYTPTTGYLGPDSFTYTVKDGAGDSSNVATVNLSVTPNILPTAAPDSATTAEDNPVTISVLANDTDPDGSLVPGSVTVVDNPANGTVVVNANGSITYTPTQNFNGTDTFTYTVTDSAGGTSTPATVTVTVNDVNDLPVATDDAKTTNEDTAVIVDVLTNDIEVDGSFDLASVTIGTNPANGTVVVNADGTITYTPNANFNGSDSFTYTVKDDDGDISNVATVNVTVTAVNDVPTAGDDAATTNEDTAVANINVLQNDSDVDGTLVPGTVAIATQSANGTAVVNADGTITFTPAANFNGTTTFTYTVKDNQGGTSAPATVTVTVNSVNDAPVAVDDAETTSEDVALTISILGNDSDVDGSLAPGSVVIGTQPSNGTVAVQANGSVLYTPNANYNGPDSFTYTVKDNNGATSNSATVNITVTAGNDPPVLAIPIPDRTATEDSPFSYSFPGGTFVELDGETLTYTATLESGAALPGWLSFNPITRTFSGVPTNSDVGAIAVRVTATDPALNSISDTFTLTVDNVNDAPTVGTPIPGATATEGSPFTFTVPANSFVDIDAGDTLTYSATLTNGSPLPAWLSFDPATQTFTGTPGNNDVEPLTIRVRVRDTSLATVTSDFTLTIDPVNDAPTVAALIANQTAPEDSPFSFTVPGTTFSDPDGDTLTYSATLENGSPLPSWLTFNPLTRNFSGTPTNGEVGTITLRVIATDPIGASNSTTFGLTITNTNDAPTVGTAIPDQAATEDSPFTFAVPSGSFVDIDPGATLTYTASLAGGGALPSWLTFDAATQTFSGTPGNANVGSITLQVQATDGLSAPVTSTFTLTVTNINTPPTLVTPLVDQNATEDTPFNFTVPAGSFADPDSGDSLTYTATLEDGNPLPAWLIFNPANQTFSGTPANGNVGSINVRITATDGAGASVSDVMQVAIANTNDSPVLNSAIANQTATEGVAFNFTLPLGRFSDPDVGDVLTYTATLSNGNPLPSWLTFNPTTQTFSGTPGNADVSASPLTIQVRATDQAGASATGNFTLTIDNVNNPPELANPITNKTATEDNLFSFAVPSNTFTDPDGDPLTYSATQGNGSALPAWLTFNPTTRTFSGTPTNAQVGTITVQVTATDNASNSNSTTFDLTVNNVNDPPTTAIPIPNQTATRDTLFNYAFPSGTFTDIDAGDTLTYTATLADGSSLPGWLSFDAATRTFSGTPGIADIGAGSLSIRVRATDSGGAIATSIFSLTLVNPNTPPSAGTSITDKNATEDSSFSFTVPSTAFTDPDPGDTLTYTATLASGAALPTWLSFNPTTRTFSGTPRNGDVGSISVRVTATDKASTSATTTFNLTVANTNDAPTVATPLPDQTGKEGNLFTFVVPSATITDVDTGDTVTYSAQLSSGAALPSWLTFNPTTRTFSGTPTITDVGSLSIRVTGTDGQGATASDIFTLTVDPTTINASPVLAVPIADQTVSEGTALNFTFAANAFTDSNGDALTYTARLEDGSALPGWLTFNPSTRTFSSALTSDSEVGTYNILVTASDPFFASASDVFTLRVSNVNDAPAVIPSRGTLPYTEDAALLDDSLTIIDVDSPLLSGASVRFTSGYVAGQDILTFTPQGGIAGNFNTNTGVLTLVGAASPEVYQTVLRSVTYRNSVANSNSPPRTIQIKVSDQTLDSTPQQIQVVFQNRPPVLDLNGSDAGVDYSTSGQSGTQIPVVDTDLIVSDADGSVISSALIVISNPIDWIQEQLKVNTAGTNISAVYNSESGNLTLTGTATVAAYQQVLRTLTYSNMAVDPNVTVRKILFIINDGKNNSIQAETTLTLTPGTPSGNGGGNNSGGGNSGGGTNTPEPPVRGPSSLVTSPQTDVVNGSSTDDTVTTPLANLQQNDTINGGSGTDTFVLTDGTGIATVIVETSGNQISGIIPPGTVISNFERFDFSGFSGNTTMTGSDSFDDVLIGGAGRDRLSGLAGNDTLVGNGSKDKLNGGVGNDNLDGGRGKDKLIGGDGNDTLKGNGGKDILKGGGGADTIVLTSAKQRDRDIIRDFNAAEDVIQISKAGFSNQLASGQLSASQFVLGSQAGDGTDRFIYNQNTGALFFDRDGAGGSTQVQIATFSNRPTLSAADIVIIP